MNIETATLAGGCFWCVEAVFDELNGVESVESGYMGGHKLNPTYGAVCDGNTGHAEIVQVKFDADTVSFKELLEVFFTVHDPTQLNRQGNDVGTQYRRSFITRPSRKRWPKRRLPRSTRARSGASPSSPKSHRLRSSTSPRTITRNTKHAPAMRILIAR